MISYKKTDRLLRVLRVADRYYERKTNTKYLKSSSYYETKIKISYETSSTINNYPQKPLEVFYKERCS